MSAARTVEEGTEEDGPVLWWRFPVNEPPYVGTPLDCGQPITVAVSGAAKEFGKTNSATYWVGGWPGYHTHWTQIETPAEPTLAAPSAAAPAGYRKLPKGMLCRCIRLWTDGADHYCCKRSSAAPLDEDDAPLMAEE